MHHGIPSLVAALPACVALAGELNGCLCSTIRPGGVDPFWAHRRASESCQFCLVSDPVDLHHGMFGGALTDVEGCQNLRARALPRPVHRVAHLAV